MVESSQKTRLISTYTIRHREVDLSASMPIQIQSYDRNSVFGIHDHDYYEICMIRGGSVVHLTDSGTEELSTGAVIVVPVGAVHAFPSSENAAFTNIYYLPEWLSVDLGELWNHQGLIPLFLGRSLFRAAAAPVPQVLQLTTAELAACAAALNEIEVEYEQHSPSLPAQKASFIRFLGILSRVFVRQRWQNVVFDFRAEVRAAIDEIEQCINDVRPMNVPAIAQRVDLSYDYFAQVFRTNTGLAPMEYYQLRRVQKAAAMLLTHRARVGDVAQRLGYSDTAHLSRLFTQYQKMTPSAYRRMYANKGSRF